MVYFQIGEINLRKNNVDRDGKIPVSWKGDEKMDRADGRDLESLRPVRFITGVNRYAEGSVLVQWGQTHVLCTASVEENVPPFLAGTGKGWITAEYAMLPRSTQSRKKRDISKLKLDGRSGEIQRLIGRSLRAAVDFEKLGERQIVIDCDVLQADGGTRTASITGGYIALALAVKKLMAEGILTENPLREQIAAVSVGIVAGIPMLDLCYVEDSHADVDMNLVRTASGGFAEIQGTGEGRTFLETELAELLRLGKIGTEQLFALQKKAIEEA